VSASYWVSAAAEGPGHGTGCRGDCATCQEADRRRELLDQVERERAGVPSYVELATLREERFGTA